MLVDKAGIRWTTGALTKQRLRDAAVLLIDRLIVRELPPDDISSRLLLLAAKQESTVAILADARHAFHRV